MTVTLGKQQKLGFVPKTTKNLESAYYSGTSACMASDKTVYLCKIKYNTVTYRETLKMSLLLFKNKKQKKTHLHKTKFERHSKLFHNYLTSEFSSLFQDFFTK